MIRLSGQIENLSGALSDFGDKLVHLEEVRLANQDARIAELEKAWQQIRGGWKLAVVLWFVVSAALGWIIAWQLKHT